MSNTHDNTAEAQEIMSPTSQFALPLRSSMAQQEERQREDSDGESQAKRVRWADSEPEWGQQADLSSSHSDIDNNRDDGNDNDEIVDNVIKVLVDNDKHQFFVHEDAICARSGLFKAMISSSASQGKFMRLPTMSSRAFRTYIHWLKTKRVSLKTWFNRTHRGPQVTEQQKLQAYMDIYVLADQLDDGKLRRFLMKTFIKNCPDLGTIPSSEWCTAIWKQTLQGSVLRAFLVEWTYFRYAWLAKSEQFAREASSYPEEFCEEFAKLTSERGPNNVARKAFQDAMRARLLQRRQK